MSKYFFFLLVGILFFGIATKPLYSKDNYRYNINNKIETPNFVILYNENMGRIATELANNIEKWGNQVFTYHGAKPRVKIYVYLQNNTDTVNAYSYLNVINLWLNSFLLYNFYTDWLETTFKHELTHNTTLLFDKSPLYIYTFAYLDRLISPTWVEEGLATYNETKLHNPLYKNGRGRNEEFLSEIRYKYNSGISANYFYYKTSSPYDDGLSFFKFYGDTYGQDVHKKAINAYVGSFLNKLIYSPVTIYARNVGLTTNELYQEYDKYLSKEYGLQDRNYTEGNLLFADEFTDQNAVSKILEIKDSKLYYAGRRKNIINGTYKRGVFSYNLENKGIEQFAHISGSKIFKFHNDLYYTASSDNNILGTDYDSAYHYSGDKTFFQTDKLPFKRTSNVIATKEGIFYITRNQDSESLVQEDNTVIIPFSERLIFGEFFYDEKRNSIFFDAGAIHNNNVYIYEYNLNNKTITKLTKGREPYVYENTLYFSNYVEGSRYNIYSFNLTTKQTKQLTDTKFGAFKPAYANGILYYVSSYNYSNGIYSLSADKFLNHNENSFTVDGNNNIKITNTSLNSEIASMNTPVNVNDLKGLYKVSSISMFDYRLAGMIIMPGTLNFQLESLSFNNSLSMGISEVDYGLYKKDDIEKRSAELEFIYHPNKSSTPLFKVEGYYADNDRKLLTSEFTPILYNGYGNIPSVIGKATLNTYRDYDVGATLNFLNRYSIILSGGHVTQYKKTEEYNYLNVSFYDMFSASYFQGKSIDFNVKVNPKVTWKVKNTDYVLRASLYRDFVFDTYWGVRDSRIGVDKIILRPAITHLYSGYNRTNIPDKKLKTHQSTYYDLGIYFVGRLQYSIPVTIAIGSVYGYNYSNYGASYNDTFKHKQDFKVYWKIISLFP